MRLADLLRLRECQAGGGIVLRHIAYEAEMNERVGIIRQPLGHPLQNAREGVGVRRLLGGKHLLDEVDRHVVIQLHPLHQELHTIIGLARLERRHGVPAEKLRRNFFIGVVAQRAQRAGKIRHGLRIGVLLDVQVGLQLQQQGLLRPALQGRLRGVERSVGLAVLDQKDRQPDGGQRAGSMLSGVAERDFGTHGIVVGFAQFAEIEPDALVTGALFEVLFKEGDSCGTLAAGRIAQGQMAAERQLSAHARLKACVAGQCLAELSVGDI